MSLTVPTYIRTEDQDKYLAIKNRERGAWTEFIHKALNAWDHAPVVQVDEVRRGPLIEPKEPEMDILKQGRGGRYGGDSPIQFEHGAPIPKSFSARKRK